MPRDCRVTVTPGQIAVSTVDMTASGPGFAVFEADCDSKYPEAMTILSADGVPELWLYAGERTLRPVPGTDKPTIITLPGWTAGWTATGEATRYTALVVAWRPGGRRPAWAEAEQEER
jgi:hypothetical protein